MKNLMDFQSFVNKLNESREIELVTEAFNSSIIQKLSDQKQGGIGKEFFDTLSRMGIAASQITNADIIQVTPADAPNLSKKNPNLICIYYSTTEKPNPFLPSGGDKWSYGTIKADTVLAVVKGKLFMGLDYDRWSTKKGGKATYRMVPAGDAGRTLGLGNKDTRGWSASGLSTLAKMAEVSDVVYVIDPSTIPSTTELRKERQEQKAGAAAYIDDKDFKKANMSRYEEILRQRASTEDIDKLIADVIEELTNQIKTAIADKKMSKYGEVLIGTDAKGREVRMSDAANLMRNILDEYGRWATDKETAADSEKRWGESDRYYVNSANQRAKNIKDYANKVKTMNYAW